VHHPFFVHFFVVNARLKVAGEQALRGSLAAEREKEGELATTSLEFEYLHRKFDAKC